MCRFEGICGLIICVNNNWAASRFVFSPDICGRLGSKHQLTCWSGRSRFVTLWWCVTVKQGWFDGEFSGQPVYCEAPTQKKKKMNKDKPHNLNVKKKKNALSCYCAQTDWTVHYIDENGIKRKRDGHFNVCSTRTVDGYFLHVTAILNLDTGTQWPLNPRLTGVCLWLHVQGSHHSMQQCITALYGSMLHMPPSLSWRERFLGCFIHFLPLTYCLSFSC